MTVDSSELLSVSLVCDRSTTTSNYGPAACTIKITNSSPAALTLSNRLEVAYKDRGSRDIYFLLMRNGKVYNGTDEFAFASRSRPLTAEHYQLVPPGAAIGCTIQLENYYHLPPGMYRLRAVYEPAAAPVYTRSANEASREAWFGSIASNEIELEVRDLKSGHEGAGAEPLGPVGVSLTCDRHLTKAGESATCTVAITNVGQAPLCLNQRFMVSYPSNPLRDLFFDILKNGKPYLGSSNFGDEYCVDTKPKFLTKQHYSLIQPGNSLTHVVPLDRLYRLRPGQYSIRAVYAPEPSDVEPAAWSGLARSNEISLEVR